MAKAESTLTNGRITERLMSEAFKAVKRNAVRGYRQGQHCMFEENLEANLASLMKD